MTPARGSKIQNRSQAQSFLAGLFLSRSLPTSISLPLRRTLTSACADMAPELEKLRTKSVQKIRDFLLQRVASLRKKMTNIQILQQSVLLKYKKLYHFLQEHAPDVAAEVKETYTTTMSAIYLRHVKGYLAELMRARTEPASKSDLLGTEEWAVGSTFGGND